jgi:hypothetical protein
MGEAQALTAVVMEFQPKETGSPLRQKTNSDVKDEP